MKILSEGLKFLHINLKHLELHISNSQIGSNTEIMNHFGDFIKQLP